MWLLFIYQGYRLSKRVEMPTIMLLYYNVSQGISDLVVDINAGLFPQGARTSASYYRMAVLAYGRSRKLRCP